MRTSWKISLPLLVLGLGLGAAALGQDAETVTVTAESAMSAATDAMFTVNNVWMMVATFLVFTMHLGFASLESGLTRAKNTTNILFKNTAIVSIGLLTYALLGFALMYPGGEFKFFGFAGWGLALPEGGATAAYNPGYTYWTDFLFQGMFAATAATIVSGAVAERVKLSTFLIFTALYVGIVYPIVGSWKWGGGWLDQLGFYDFAGSTLVHSVGGWAALVAVIILGPRLGKYVEGKGRAIPGHSMPLATIGVFLLWLGWFGFNGGSVLSADAGLVSYVLVTTSLAAAAGVIAAIVTSWVVQKKPDLTMALNGALAGLVGITAGADVISVSWSIVVGAIAGVIVVLAVLFIDQKLRIDDPVGALSVHLVCGIWGTLAVGIFGYTTNDAGIVEKMPFMPQLIGVVAVGVTCIVSTLILWGGLKALMGVRVPAEEELRGLDIGEHGMEAYGGFQIFSTQ